jgi:hypothetical protein
MGGVGGTRGRIHETSCSALLVVSDERYLSVAKVPSSHSAARARVETARMARLRVVPHSFSRERWHKNGDGRALSQFRAPIATSDIAQRAAFPSGPCASTKACSNSTLPCSAFRLSSRRLCSSSSSE